MLPFEDALWEDECEGGFIWAGGLSVGLGHGMVCMHVV